MGISSGIAGAVGALPAGAVIPYAGSTAPANWLLCGGQAVSRTDYAALFAVIGTTYGAGNGSTTFNLPDLRGRVVAGEDDMGGTAANRLTNATSGITGTTLGSAGGDERLHLHQHANTATFTGTAVNSAPESAHTHANTLTNNAVTSGFVSNDHAHNFTTGGQSATHSHAFSTKNSAGGFGTEAPARALYGSDTTYSTGNASNDHTHSGTTGGITANHSHSVTSNVTITNAAGSSHLHSVTAAGTVAVTNANQGAGNSQNVQPTIVLNYIIKATAL